MFLNPVFGYNSPDISRRFDCFTIFEIFFSGLNADYIPPSYRGMGWAPPWFIIIYTYNIVYVNNATLEPPLVQDALCSEVVVIKRGVPEHGLEPCGERAYWGARARRLCSGLNC